MWEKSEDVNSGNLFLWRDAIVLTWEATAVELERFAAWDQMLNIEMVSNLKMNSWHMLRTAFFFSLIKSYI